MLNPPIVRIRREDLPDEARETLARIDRGGPFLYTGDGVPFHNREKKLPVNEKNYREYTVNTPGSNDRGARRVVVGDNGDRYYIDDHYRTFQEIVE